MNSIINRISRLAYNRSVGLFLIRLALGLLFFTHGLMKVEFLSQTYTEFVLMLVSFALMFLGSGQFSVYKMGCENCGGMVCDGEGNCVVVG